MSTASALKLPVRLVQGSRVESIHDRLVGFLVEVIEDRVQRLVVQTGLERSVLVCAAACAADIESAQVVEVGHASAVWVSDEALADGGEGGGEVAGQVEEGRDGFLKG